MGPTEPGQLRWTGPSGMGSLFCSVVVGCKLRAISNHVNMVISYFIFVN